MGWDGVDRREGVDWRIRFLRVSAVLSWLLYIACLVLFHYARPEFNSGVARYYGHRVRLHWDPYYSDLLIYLIWLCCGLSLLSLLAGYHRSRRYGDNRRYNLILLASVTLASSILFTYQILLS